MSERADAIDFHLPDVGEGLAEAEIVRWLVEPGGKVSEDQPVVEVETDKAVVEITSPVDGILVRHGAGEGEVLKIGALLAVFAPPGADRDGADRDGADRDGADRDGADRDGAEGDGTRGGEAAGTGGEAAGTAAATATVESAGDRRPAGADAGTGQPATPNGRPTAPPRRPLATPATRGLARELGVDLTTVTGTGPGGRIVDADVTAAAERRTDAPAEEPAEAPRAPRTEPAPTRAAEESPAAASGPAPVAGPQRGITVAMRGLRRATAQRMTTAWREVPHVNSVHEVDMSALFDLRTRLADDGHRLPLTAFLVKATASALLRWPSLNATVDEEAGTITYHDRVDLAVAADTDEGLLVPVLRAVDRAPLARVGSELSAAMERARERRLSPEELRGATFTVNNYGPLGGWFGTSLVSPGQVGILSMGPARDRVVPVDGEITIRPVAVIALAADHRVADGRELIGFCLTVRDLLERPLSLLVEE